MGDFQRGVFHLSSPSTLSSPGSLLFRAIRLCPGTPHPDSVPHFSCSECATHISTIKLKSRHTFPRSLTHSSPCPLTPSSSPLLSASLTHSLPTPLSRSLPAPLKPSLPASPHDWISHFSLPYPDQSPVQHPQWLQRRGQRFSSCPSPCPLVFPSTDLRCNAPNLGRPSGSVAGNLWAAEPLAWKRSNAIC